VLGVSAVKRLAIYIAVASRLEKEGLP